MPNNSGQKFVNIGMKISLISRIILGKCKQKAQEETIFLFISNRKKSRYFKKRFEMVETKTWRNLEKMFRN